MAFIEAKEISRIYRFGDMEVKAISHISTRIEKGEFVAIMGPSGSGKSTFMNILGCLDKPTGGRYLLDGVDVDNLDRDELAGIRNKKIGFVFQGFNLLSRTSALENVELPMLYNGTSAKDRKQRAREALKAVGLENREKYNPNRLSGGQQQMVAIARAIVNKAHLILADEPTGNLDTKTSLEIMKLFLRLNTESDITIVVVTHEPSIATHSRRIIKFLDGEIISDEKAGES